MRRYIKILLALLYLLQLPIIFRESVLEMYKSATESLHRETQAVQVPEPTRLKRGSLIHVYIHMEDLIIRMDISQVSNTMTHKIKSPLMSHKFPYHLHSLMILGKITYQEDTHKSVFIPMLLLHS